MAEQRGASQSSSILEPPDHHQSLTMQWLSLQGLHKQNLIGIKL